MNHRRYDIICQHPDDFRLIEENILRDRDEMPAEALGRLKGTCFEPVAVHECIPGELCEDRSSDFAEMWLRDLRADGWQSGDVLPDFVWRNIPASEDTGYRPRRVA